METLRTPYDRFRILPGFPFEPRYVEVADPDGGTVRVHYLDEGPTEGPPVLLLHGEPSWSYLYRTMIPALAAAGHRCIAPNLIGLGRNDKPVSLDDYSYARHVGWMAQVVFDHLDLKDVTYFGQDWGGLIGLRLVAADPERFARVVAANTSLPTGEEPLSMAFLSWQRFAGESPFFPAGSIISHGCATALDPAVVAAHDAPFPDERFTAGARSFPGLVPTRPDEPAHDENRAAREVLRSFTMPFLCAFSDGDPITSGGDRMFRREVPGGPSAAGADHVAITGGGHFLQENRGPELAGVIRDFAARA